MPISRRRNGWHAKDDIDVIPVHLNPPDHHSDEVTCTVPIKLIQSPVNSLREFLQATDNQRQIVFRFGGVDQRLAVFFKTCQPLLHAHNAGLELRSIDQSFRIAVDDPADAAA